MRALDVVSLSRLQLCLRSHHFEERLVNTAQKDGFVRIMSGFHDALDLGEQPSSFAEIASELSSLEGRMLSHRRHSEAASFRHYNVHHSPTRDFEAGGLMGLRVNARGKRGHTKSSAGMMTEIRNRKGPVREQSSDVATGELLSEFHGHKGASVTPCLQDAEHMCIISVDSGHSLMSGPPDVIQKIKAQLVPADASHVGSCDPAVFETMPDVSFAIGGKLFTMTPEDYLVDLGGNCVPAFSERPTRNGHDWVRSKIVRQNTFFEQMT